MNVVPIFTKNLRCAWEKITKFLWICSQIWNMMSRSKMMMTLFPVDRSDSLPGLPMIFWISRRATLKSVQKSQKFVTLQSDYFLFKSSLFRSFDSIKCRILTKRLFFPIWDNNLEDYYGIWSIHLLIFRSRRSWLCWCSHFFTLFRSDFSNTQWVFVWIFAKFLSKVWHVGGKIFEEKLFILSVWRMLLQIFSKIFCQF
jgi:hypothetical protein